MGRLLVVEDDRNLSVVIQTCLEADRHIVDLAANPSEALACLKVTEYDLIVLDWNLPQMSGIDICRHYRSNNGRAPILMLTAKSDADDKVLALDAGADDYVPKPFDVKELQARVRALLRRPAALVSDVLTVAGVQLNANTLQAKTESSTVTLALKEFALLELLMRHPNKSFSPEAIMNRLWPTDTESTPDVVRTHVKNLRRKLGDADGSLIKHTRGLGYGIFDQA